MRPSGRPIHIGRQRFGRKLLELFMFEWNLERLLKF